MWATNEMENARPVAAAVAVVQRGGNVLLVRRRNRPDAGRWCLPGGKIESGESIGAAVLRELFEETHVEACTERVLAVASAFDREFDGALLQHFVIVVVRCRWLGGEPVAGDDALDASWFPTSNLGRLDLARCIDIPGAIRLASARRRHASFDEWS
ncbi:NUDIX hydrolase [Burkholderia pyrrocinia]|uniref:NUDIX hydrolase n=1 Tax=Burkholderia pyrrocinia TaxID=60550 RepID=UPI00104AE4C0|nr:NUDIX hydrolase [Burkholderia pyrrocinia]TDA47874.1 NUDIX domain-containing protein [Burkholderia pyrrocinia]